MDLNITRRMKFLGSVIEREGKCDMEIKRRVAIGKTAMNGMEKIWKDKHASLDTKKRLVRDKGSMGKKYISALLIIAKHSTASIMN